MSDKRPVWQKLAGLLPHSDKKEEANRAAQVTENGRSAPTPDPLEAVEKELRKLGKAQFKANTLAESQLARWEEALEMVQQAQKTDAEQQQKLVEQQVAAAQHKLLQAMIPALDGLENALQSGQRFLKIRDLAAGLSDKSAAQAVLVSPADRAMLAGWLDGLRLIRERLLAILEAGGVTAIPAVGHPFNPYLHTAVATTKTANAPTIEPGTIVAEERRGYQSAAGVLRYAEVIVYKP
jgi:molecular chaperone GrpE